MAGHEGRTNSWLNWWDVVGLLAVTVFGFAVARGWALAVPIVTTVATVLQVVRMRARRVEVTADGIVVSSCRREHVYPLDRARLRFVNLEDYGRYMSPVLEEVGADGRVVRRVTLRQLRFIDAARMTDDQFLMQNRASLERYERIAAAVSDAEPAKRWLAPR